MSAWRSSAIQSVAFSRDQWTDPGARAWLQDHGYLAPSVDETAKYLRYRQRSPEAFSVMRWLPLSEPQGIFAIVGRPTNPGDEIEPGERAWEIEDSGASFALLTIEADEGWISYTLIQNGEPVLDLLLPENVSPDAVIEDLILPWIALWRGEGP